MQLHGKHYIGGELSSDGTDTFTGVDPAASQALPTDYRDATSAEVDRAMSAAESAFDDYRNRTPDDRAGFLDAIAAEIESTGDPLIERAHAETALPVPRLQGERARTANQLRMFSAMLREGSWVQARIDRAIPDRKPLPKPDLRRMFVPLGPVVAFAASNFPLAISVAGNDTAAGFAAGCPVVVKAHPAHPGTSEIIAEAVTRAVKKTGMHPGVFSMLHGRGHDLGLALVRHPLTAAVGFTGSLRGGRALFDAANARPVPIPVYAEMGSINPVFVLPGALAERGPQIAEGLKNSVTLGVGQFCTNPGLVVGIDGSVTREFVKSAAELLSGAPAGTMLYKGIRDAFLDGVRKFRGVRGVTVAAGSAPATGDALTATPTLFTTDAATFLANPALSEELFGPSTLVVTGSSTDDLVRIARGLAGHLTATIHGTAQDLEDHRELIAVLQRKVGRLVFNGFPTGIEPCPSVHHGGPYPACSDGGRSTSIGTAAVERFVRPLCYQDFPQAALPEELKDSNPRGIWRLLDGELTKGPVR